MINYRRRLNTKPKILVFSLTGCSGCIASMMSLDVSPQLLERTELLFFPFIHDNVNVIESDIAIVEGCVSTEQQIPKLKDVRNKAKKVYALGTCAAFGGILSLSKKKIADPISNYIEIDGFIPGCPPPSHLMGNYIIRLIENKEFFLPEKNMCESCPLRKNFDPNFIKDIIKIYPAPEDIILPEENPECFLKRGILCLGPIIREGCEHNCIQNGLPCEGCMGPVSRDLTSNIVNFLSLLNIEKDLKKYKGIFYRFSKPKIRR